MILKTRHSYDSPTERNCRCDECGRSFNADGPMFEDITDLCPSCADKARECFERFEKEVR